MTEDDFYQYGEPLGEADGVGLAIPSAIAFHRACIAHPDFQIVETRKLNRVFQPGEIVVANCLNHRVGPKQKQILFKERLAFVFFADPMARPEVRTLRKSFPMLSHQNLTLPGEPIDLCLNAEGWNSVRRTWTPQKHLERVLWWMETAANKTIHATDQPLEPIYFQGKYDVVLPPGWEDDFNRDGGFFPVQWYRTVDPRGNCISELSVLAVPGSPITRRIQCPGSPNLQLLLLDLPERIHGRIDFTPNSIGLLHDDLSIYGFDLIGKIRKFVQKIHSDQPGMDLLQQRMMIFCRVPLKRDPQSIPEIKIYGFFVNEPIETIGISAEAFSKITGSLHSTTLLGDNYQEEAWKAIGLQLLNIHEGFSRELARKYNGIGSDKGPIGTLVGGGSLGSHLALAWTRMGWGQWSVLDDDRLQSHNLARHTALFPHLGMPKPKAIELIATNALPFDADIGISGVPKNALTIDDPEVELLYKTSKIIVDASASLEVPRSLAPMEAIGKCVSVFFTPNARDSVLLGEDSGRTIRLDSLESQYYRAILRNDWGYSHLAGHLDPLRYGGGCRDLSHQMPYDLVSLHGSLLARQIRLYSFGVEAKAFVWQTLEAPFSIAVHELNIWPPLSIQCDSWRVHWDEGIKKEIRDTRTKALPSETGGVLLGYRDHVLKTIYIVDSIPAPPDSHSSPDFFERGFEGLVGKVEEASRRTSRIVTYIGEWHSHPKGASVSPSSRDKILFNYLLHYFATEGLPAVMLIIGDSDETWIASEFSF